jgi:hypothetical protein
MTSNLWLKLEKLVAEGDLTKIQAFLFSHQASLKKIDGKAREYYFQQILKTKNVPLLRLCTEYGLYGRVNIENKLIISTLEETIELRHAYLKSIPWEVNLFPFLKRLDLSFNRIEGFANLDYCYQLKELNLSNNRIAKIENIPNILKLQILELANNYIERIEAIHEQNELKILTLNSNKIERIQFLPCNLTKLSLSNNLLSRIEGLEEQAQLQELQMRENQLQSIAGLASLKQLKVLDMARNKLKKIENLTKLENLEMLELGQNQIEHITGLEKLEHLIYLGLANNKIMRMENTYSLASLRQILLMNNPIREIDYADYRNILKEINGQTRKNLVQIVGIEKLEQSLQLPIIHGKTINQVCYQLIEFNHIYDQGSIGQILLPGLNELMSEFRLSKPFLKMQNPSTGEWHIEGVHPSCRTVEQALAWRNGEEEYIMPRTLT